MRPGQPKAATGDWPAPAAAGLLLLIIALFGAIPLLQTGLFASHDGVFHVYRLQALDAALRDGTIYPRWAGDFYFGYGSPIFNYLPMLPYYMGEAFHLLGLGYIASTKAVALLALLAAPVGAWLYARPLLSPPAALAVGIAYAFVPYRFVDLYTRGNFPEYLAFIWFPLVLWSFRKMVWEGRQAWMPGAALFLAALLLTHTPSALLFLPVLGLHLLGWAILRRRQAISVLSRAALALFLSAVIAAVYLIPALLEQYAVYAERVRATPGFTGHFPAEGLFGLLSIDLVHRYALGVLEPDVFPYRVGLLQWLLAVLGGAALFWRWRRTGTLRRMEGALAVVTFAGAVLMCLALIRPLWQALPLLRTIQFPWRWLMIAALPSALLAGLLVDRLPLSLKPATALALALAIVLNTVPYLRPPQSHFLEAQVTAQGQQALESAYAVIGTTTNAEWVPIGVGIDLATALRGSPWALARLRGEDGDPIAFAEPEGVVGEIIHWQGQRRTVQLTTAERSFVAFNLLSFPGWRAWVDDREVPVSASKPDGFLAVEVPGGTHVVTIRFDETPLRRFANALSLVGLVVAATAFWRLRGRPRPGGLHLDRRDAALLVALAMVWAGLWRSYGASSRTSDPYQTPHRLGFDGGLWVEGYTVEGLTLGPNGYMLAQDRERLRLSVYWRWPNRQETDAPQFNVSLSTYRRQWALARLSGAQPAGIDGLRASHGVLRLPAGLPPGAYVVGIEAASSAGELLDLKRFQHSAVYSGIESPGFFLVTEPALNQGNDLPFESGGLFGGKAELLGYAVTPVSLPPAMAKDEAGAPSGPVWSVAAGEALRLTLLWRAESDALPPLRVVARLLSPEGDLYAAAHEEPAGGLYPTRHWQRGQLVRDTLGLPIPLDTPPGAYRLALELHAPDGPLSLSDARGSPAGTTLALGEVQLAPAPALLLEPPVGPTTPLPGGIDLVSIEHAASIGQGERLYLLTHWWARAPQGRDVLAKITLVDSAGRPWTTAEGPPGGESSPTSRWRPNERLRRWFHLPIPADVPAGDYALLASLKAPDGQGSTPLEVGRVQVTGRPHRFDMPPGLTPSDAAFGELVALRAYRVGENMTAAAAAPGQRLPVLLAWQALQPTERPLAVSVQLLDAAGRLVAQHDGVPQDGHAPVSGWLPDEVVEDRHELALPAALPPGEHTITVVVYDTLTGQRLLTLDGRDALPLQALTVLP